MELTNKSKLYEELKQKVEKMSRYDIDALTDEELNNLTQNKAILIYVSSGYTNKRYKIFSNLLNLTNDELALYADDGNLYFGYRMENNDTIVVYTD